MQYKIITILLLISFSLISKSMDNPVYNFKTDYYCDSTLYKSEMSYYYEIINGEIHESHYPVKVSDYVIVKDDSTIEEFYYTDDFHYNPYSFHKNEDSIFIVFFSYYLGKNGKHLQYIIDTKDSVSLLLEKSNLINKQNEMGNSVAGKSKYLGKKSIVVNNSTKETYCFEEYRQSFNVDTKYYYKTEIYIECETLIPIQFINWQFDKKLNYTGHYSIRSIKSITDTVPKFINKEDLVLFAAEECNKQ